MTKSPETCEARIIPTGSRCKRPAGHGGLCHPRAQRADRVTNWTVTLKTAPNTWSIVEVEAPDHGAAITEARRLLGDHPVTNVI